MAVFTLGYSGIQSVLHTDLKSAIPTVTRIYDGVPYLPTNAAQLPIIFINLPQVDLDFGDGVGVQQIGSVFNLDITLLKAKPSSGTIQAAQISDADAIIAKLYAAGMYAGCVWEPGSISFNEEQLASSEAIYTVTVSVRLRLISKVH